MTVIPNLIRGACSKQKSLFICMDLLNTSFQQIQPMNTSNVSDLLNQINDLIFDVIVNIISGWYMSNSLSTTSFIVNNEYEKRWFNYAISYLDILASNEIFEIFLNLSNSLDDLDKELINIYTLFQTLEIPSTWLQSSLFDWKQVSHKINNIFCIYLFILDKYW